MFKFGSIQMRNVAWAMVLGAICLTLLGHTHRANAFDVDSARRTVIQDNMAEMELIKQLQSPDLKVVDSSIKKALDRADSVSPAVLYSMAGALAKVNRQNEAVFWYHVGKMRVQFDIMRNRDRSLGDVPTVLAMGLPKPLLQAVYLVGNPDDMLNITKTAIDWDNSHGHNYNPLWPVPHGLGIFSPGEEGLAPESQWQDMNDSVHTQWLNVMTKAADDIRAIQAKP